MSLLENPFKCCQMLSLMYRNKESGLCLWEWVPWAEMQGALEQILMKVQAK